jgi:hypothetical protein
MREAEPRRVTSAYAIGRPLLFTIWVIALWGTGTGARLLWLFITDEAKALRLIALPSVWVPIALAAVMWIALGAAVRNFRRHGEP